MFPPFTGTAVKVTDVPAHIGPNGTDVIVTDAEVLGVTDTTIGFDITDVPAAQPELGVSIQVIVSLLINEALVNTAAFVPTVFPFKSQ